jgi:hypothetical protein
LIVSHQDHRGVHLNATLLPLPPYHLSAHSLGVVSVFLPKLDHWPTAKSRLSSNVGPTKGGQHQKCAVGHDKPDMGHRAFERGGNGYQQNSRWAAW